MFFQMDDLDSALPLNPSPSTRTAEEYDVENADYISEMLVSDVLTSSVGKQSMKVMILLCNPLVTHQYVFNCLILCS